MRIIAGEARGRRLVVPKGNQVRPTPDRVRQALFSMLGGRCDGLRVLDLFAGSGALGLEALSRGAQHVTFVEQDRRALGCLRHNVAQLDAQQRRTRILPRNVFAALDAVVGPIDLVLMDPPYALALVDQALGALVKQQFLAADARVVVDHGAQQQLCAEVDGRLDLLLRRSYGEVAVALYGPKPKAGASTPPAE